MASDLVGAAGTLLPLPLAGEVGTRSVTGGGSFHANSVTRGDTPTPALPRKRERGKKGYFASALYLVSSARSSVMAASGSASPFFLTPSAQLLTNGSAAFFQSAVCSGVSV